MKKTQYILLSSLLSMLIIYMGVGIPFVQYRCMSCADPTDVKPLLMVAQIADGGCDCGCSGTDKASGASSSDRAKKCCCADNASGGCCGASSDESGCCVAVDCESSGTDSPETANGGCRKVRVEKISLPTLAEAMHLDNVEMPPAGFLFCNLIVPDIVNNQRSEGRCCDGAPPYTLLPRAYINLICSLLI